MIRHSKIQTVIDTPETREFLKDLFHKNLNEGEDKTSVLRFVETLTDILKDEVGTLKGKRITVNDGWRDEVKNRFTRGKKWVKVQKEDKLYQTAVDLARENDFDNLIDLWEDKGFAWVRFHSSTKDGANFSIHENSSVGSNIKLSVDRETASNIEIMNGTPKSNGYEQKTVNAEKEEEVSEDVIDEEVNDDSVEDDSENDDSENDDSENDDSVEDEEEFVFEDEV
jgi:hypothetical protein